MAHMNRPPKDIRILPSMIVGIPVLRALEPECEILIHIYSIYSTLYHILYTKLGSLCLCALLGPS